MPASSRRAFVLSRVASLSGDVLHPVRRVGIASHRRRIRDLEEGQDVALARVEEQMHVRVRRLGRRNVILRNGQDELHVEVLGVPVDRLLGVATTIGDVMDALDQHVVSEEDGFSKLVVT